MKRNLATILWFVAGWYAGGLVVVLMDLPSLLALVAGVLMAGLVRWDPAGLLWSRREPARRVTPINDFANELDRRAAAPVAALAPEGDRHSR